MIRATWGDMLAPTVAALIVERPHLGHRLALAPRRVLHALSAFIAHALEQGTSTSGIAADVDTLDIRDLLGRAIPAPHRRLYGLLDRVGEQARPLAFYRRTNSILCGPASSLLLSSEAVDESCLHVVEELVSEPVLLAAQKAVGRSTSNLRYLRTALAFLRASGLALDVERLPSGAGWRSIKRRLTSDLGRAVAPPLPFRCPSSWRHVEKLSDLFQLGQSFNNCIGGIGSGGTHHLMQFATGTAVFLASDGDPPALACVQNVGPSLWHIGETAIGGRRPGRTPILSKLHTALEKVLAEAGHKLLETSPASAFETIGWQANRAVDLGDGLDDAA